MVLLKELELLRFFRGKLNQLLGLRCRLLKNLLLRTILLKSRRRWGRVLALSDGLAGVLIWLFGLLQVRWLSLWSLTLRSNLLGRVLLLVYLVLLLRWILLM